MSVGFSKPRPTDEDLDAINEGIEQADAGQLIPFDQIKEWVASWDTPDERPTSWPVGRLPGTRERPIEGHRVIYRVVPDTGDNKTAENVQVLRIRRPFQQPL